MSQFDPMDPIKKFVIFVIVGLFVELITGFFLLFNHFN